jgi:hypothetical protein
MTALLGRIANLKSGCADARAVNPSCDTSCTCKVLRLNLGLRTSLSPVECDLRRHAGGERLRIKQRRSWHLAYDKEIMASLQEFRCEVCGTVTSNPIHWFVIQCGDSELTVLKWNPETANATGARHFCGEAHAQVYISRWFDSVCSPSKPDFRRSASAK